MSEQSRYLSKTIATEDAKFRKDNASGALVNTDNAAYNSYKSQRDLQRRVTKLEAQVALLMDMVNKGTTK